MTKKNHPFECACCTHGKEAVDKMEQESIKKYGWYAHVVPSGDYVENTPTGFNMHTHHLPESFDQLNLQIVVPVPPEKANVFLHILHNAIDNYVRKGIKLEAGKEYDDIFENFKVTFAHARENGRPVLRMILPDKDGNITRDKIKEPYAVQYVGTELIN